MHFANGSQDRDPIDCLTDRHPTPLPTALTADASQLSAPRACEIPPKIRGVSPLHGGLRRLVHLDYCVRISVTSTQQVMDNRHV